MNILNQTTERMTAHEMYQTCLDTSEDEKVLMADHFLELKAVSDTRDVLRRVAKSKKPLFFVSSKKVLGGLLHSIKSTQCGKALIGLMLDRVYSLPAKYPDHSFAAEVLAFKQVVEQHGLDTFTQNWLDLLSIEEANTTCFVLNACVGVIRDVFNDPAFEAQRKKHTKASLKNQRSGYRWIDYILNQYTRLCVIRIDLTYQKQFQPGSPGLHSVTLKESFAHRQRFLRQLPKWIHNNALLGYMLKTEYTLRRSIHHHALIILDGTKLCSDIKIAHFLGKKWEGELTQGRGHFYNVNLHTDKSSSTCGVGDVYAHDLQMVYNLKTHVISYLCKPDHLVRWIVPKKHRLFLKSVTKLPAAIKLGRPRTISTRFAFEYQPTKMVPTCFGQIVTPADVQVGGTA